MTTMYGIEEVKKYNLYHKIKIDASNGNLIKRPPKCVICIMSDEKFFMLCLTFEFNDILYAHVIHIHMHYILKC